MESIKLASLLCIGLTGFLVFVLCGGFAKRNNKVYFGLSMSFAFLSICCLTYNSPFTNWAYIEERFIWNMIATILITAAIGSFFFGLLYIYMRISEHMKYSLKAKAAGMDIKTFKTWEEKTIHELAEQLRAQGKEVHYDELEALYTKAENELFARS